MLVGSGNLYAFCIFKKFPIEYCCINMTEINCDQSLVFCKQQINLMFLLPTNALLYYTYKMLKYTVNLLEPEFYI